MLAAVTTHAARAVGLTDRIGSIEVGKRDGHLLFHDLPALRTAAAVAITGTGVFRCHPWNTGV